MQDPIGAAMIPSSTYLNPTADDEKQPLKCPRCESTNTKFCYYNNYNLLQPRHFCKDCRRYWTKGGALRNVPVGGGTRKNSKRSATSAAAGGGASNPKRPSLTPPKPEPIRMIYPPIDQDEGMLGISGSFSSLLASADSNFENLMDTRISTVGLQSSNDSSENPMPHPVNFLGFQGDSGCWVGGWPELAIYTPGPRFQ